MGRHKLDQGQTAHRQTDFRGQPGWAMEGAQAGLCAPARITVPVLFEIVKHGCRDYSRCLQRSIGCRSSLLGDWLGRAGSTLSHQEMVAMLTRSRSWHHLSNVLYGLDYGLLRAAHVLVSLQW